jgi:hypothetical protein
MWATTGVYFVLFKVAAPTNDPERFTDFVFPTITASSVGNVTFRTKNVLLTGLCSGIEGPITSYTVGRTIALGSRDQIFVMLGFPDVQLWNPPGVIVSMSLTGLLSTVSPDKP